MTEPLHTRLTETEEAVLAAASPGQELRRVVLFGKALTSGSIEAQGQGHGDMRVPDGAERVASFGSDALRRIRSAEALGLLEDDLSDWLGVFAALDLCAWLSAASASDVDDCLVVVEDAAADATLARLIPFNSHRRAALELVAPEFRGLFPWYAEWADLPDDALEQLVQAQLGVELKNDGLRTLSQAMQDDAAHLGWLKRERTAQITLVSALVGSMGLRLLALSKERLRLDKAQTEACARAFSRGSTGMARQRDLLLFALAAPGLQSGQRLAMLAEFEKGLSASAGGLPRMVYAWNEGHIATSQLLEELETALRERLAMGTQDVAKADLAAVTQRLLTPDAPREALQDNRPRQLARFGAWLEQILGPAPVLKSALAFAMLFGVFAMLYERAPETAPVQQHSVPPAPFERQPEPAHIRLALRYYPADSLTRSAEGVSQSPPITLGENQALRSGDAFKLVVALPTPSHVALYHLGANNTVVMLAQEQIPAGEHELPSGNRRLRLDHTTGLEHFVLLTSSNAFDALRMAEELRGGVVRLLAKHPDFAAQELRIRHVEK